MNKSLITLREPRSFVSESYKMFRTNLNFINVDGNKKTFMVTSSVAEEGKSTTICNLAISIAQSNKRVLLIEGDLRCPRLHEIFEISQIPGLTNILSGGNSFGEVVYVHPLVKRLEILTSGALPPAPSELLGSLKFKELLMNARDSYDVVLIDAPPVLNVTDASIVSQWIDGTIFVVAANETSKSIILKAKKVLEKVGANIEGVVLTKMVSKKSGLYYNGYYSKDKKRKLRRIK